MAGAVLGLPGPWAEDNREPSNHYTSKIGGLPDWPFPGKCLEPTFLNCCHCGSKLCLVSQVYAPISSQGLKLEDRFLLVFVCVGQHCLSWRVLRLQKAEANASYPITIQEESFNAASPVNVSKNNWWENLNDDNDDDDDDDDSDEMNLSDLGKAFSETGNSASQSRKTNNRSNVRAGSATKTSTTNLETKVVDVDMPVLPCFYISAQVEPQSRNIGTICPNYASLAVKEKESDDDNNEEEETWEAEAYEYDKALHADRTYLKFKKQLDASPEQCFRYGFGGKPLVATAKIGEPGKCGLCGALRHFEMQLMPPLMYFLLEEADESQRHVVENWNWMTVIIHTCSNSCSKPFVEEKAQNGGWFVTEEAVTVQSDEASELYVQLGY